MKGSILDFLNLATQKPELAKAIAELAARFDFEFVADELSDAELESIAGGLTISGGPSASGMSANQVGYMCVTLQNVLVDCWTTSGDSDDRPVESIPFSNPDD